MFERLAIVLGQPDLAQPDRFGRLSNRLAGRDRLNQIVSTWTSKRLRQEVIALCSAGEVPCGPVNSIAEIFEEEQFWLRQTLTRVKDERVGDLAVQGVVPRLSETPGSIQHLGRSLGEDNAEVYRDWLDLDENDWQPRRTESSDASEEKSTAVSRKGCCVVSWISGAEAEGPGHENPRSGPICRLA